MLDDGALGSDHVNYLVLRYLQEAGFENTARSLYRDWQRNAEHADPEDLPFAAVVKPQELIHIIQDGLFHDRLQATVANGSRRFNITTKSSDTATAKGSKSTSRRQSVHIADDTDSFPLPPPKRARQEVASDADVNGDAMDIDARQSEDASRTPQISDNGGDDEYEGEAMDEMTSAPTEMKTATTQTEQKASLATDTFYWAIDNAVPGSILHAAWGPNGASQDFFMLSGESICHLHHLPPTSGADDVDLQSSDIFNMSAEHVITAAAWHPSGDYATCSVKSPSRMDDLVESRSRLVDVALSGEHEDYHDFFNMVTLVLRYNDSGDKLLSASTDGCRSVLELRDLLKDDHRKFIATFQTIPDHIVVDVVWLSNVSFAVCGSGLLAVYHIETGDEAESSLLQEFVAELPETAAVDNIRYDLLNHLLVAVSSSTGEIYTFKLEDAVWTRGPDVVLPNDLRPATVAGVSIGLGASSPDTGTDPASLLALSLLSGQILIFEVTSTSADLLHTLTIGSEEPPLTLSWAPVHSVDQPQRRLAAASDEAMKVWDLCSAADPKTLVTWKAAAAIWYQADDNHLPDDEDTSTEPLLTWDSTGERMVLAVGRKVAIISIVPDDPNQE